MRRFPPLNFYTLNSRKQGASVEFFKVCLKILLFALGLNFDRPVGQILNGAG